MTPIIKPSSELRKNYNAVAEICRKKKVPVFLTRNGEGDIVLKEGEPSDYLYYISAGSYEALHNNTPVGTLSPQDIFMGEMSFLLNQRRSASIRATTDGKLIRLTQKTFINVIRVYPHYGIFLAKLLAKRIVRSNEQNAARHDSAQFDLKDAVEVKV